MKTLEENLLEWEKLVEQIKQELCWIEELVLETQKAGEEIILTRDLNFYILLNNL